LAQAIFQKIFLLRNLLFARTKLLSSGFVPMAPTLRVASAALLASVATAAETVWYPYNVETWGRLAEGSLVCKDGIEQSPVNLPGCASAPTIRPAPTIDWHTQHVTLTNNGHTVQITPKNDPGTIPGGMHFDLTKGGIEGLDKNYTLLQCHFHHGSEHTVAGKQYVLETHCVHEMVSNDEGKRYGVAGFFFDVGVQNPFLEQIVLADLSLIHHNSSKDKRRLGFDLMGNPILDETSVETNRRLASDGSDTITHTSYPEIDFSLLYTHATSSTTNHVDLRQFYSYPGSFTTPNCDEAVDFYIFTGSQEMSAVQLTAFKDAMGWKEAGGNFRPPQLLSGRMVYGCGELPPVKKTLAWYPYGADKWSDAVGAKSAHVCKGGAAQSPINFAACKEMEYRTEIEISWLTQTIELSNNGHTVQATAKGAYTDSSDNAVNRMTANGKTYKLLQCHFHWSSEHTVGGNPYPFETHCVHQHESLLDSEGDHYGVFGQFYTIGAADTLLASMEDHLPKVDHHRRLKGSVPNDVTLDLMGNPLESASGRQLSSSVVSSWTGPLNFKSLYGNNERTQYWNYDGSFTTPPCTEAVDFYILMQPATISERQLGLYKDAIGWMSSGGNFRPPQQLGARIVSGCLVAESGAVNYDAILEKPFLSGSMQDMVTDQVRKKLASVLKEEQDSHGDQLVTLVVLATLMIFALSVVTIALFCVWAKAH